MGNRSNLPPNYLAKFCACSVPNRECDRFAIEWNETSAKFPNNISLSKQEQAELEKTATKRSQILVSTGAISPVEIRIAYANSEFTINIPLLPEVDKQIQKDQDYKTKTAGQPKEPTLSTPSPQNQETRDSTQLTSQERDIILSLFKTGILTRVDALIMLGYDKDEAKVLAKNAARELEQISPRP